MKLNDREVVKLMQLQDDIDKEAGGRCRKYYIQNRTRKIRLIFNTARRREKELEAKTRSQGIQLALFED